MRVLVVNAGPSSLKLTSSTMINSVAARELPAPGAAIDAGQVAAVRELGRVDGVGHRIVDGRERYLEAARVSDDVLTGLRELSDLAPRQAVHAYPAPLRQTGPGTLRD